MARVVFACHWVCDNNANGFVSHRSVCVNDCGAILVDHAAASILHDRFADLAGLNKGRGGKRSWEETSRRFSYYLADRGLKRDMCGNICGEAHYPPN